MPTHLTPWLPAEIGAVNLRLRELKAEDVRRYERLRDILSDALEA